MQGRGDQRFPRSGRGIEDDVLVVEQLQDRRLLSRIQFQAPLRHVLEETVEQGSIVAGGRFGSEVERCGHGVFYMGWFPQRNMNSLGSWPPSPQNLIRRPMRSSHHLPAQYA